MKKHWELVLRRLMQQKSIMPTTGLRQPHALLQTGHCHITLSPVKKPPLRCGLLLKFFDHLFIF